MQRSEELKEFNAVESEPGGHLARPIRFHWRVHQTRRQEACYFNLRGARRWGGHLPCCDWLEIGLEDFYHNNTLNSIISLQINSLILYQNS
jgi:hypothetical protein